LKTAISFPSSKFAGSRFATKRRSDRHEYRSLTGGGSDMVRKMRFRSFWMSGYYNSAANSTILNYDRFHRNSAQVNGYCKCHNSQTPPTAVQNLGLWKQDRLYLPIKIPGNLLSTCAARSDRRFEGCQSPGSPFQMTQRVTRSTRANK
jgi:hypothetical protein